MKIYLLPILFLLFSCGKKPEIHSVAGYWYGEPIDNTDKNDPEKRKGRRFVSLRMPNGHFITKQVYQQDNESSWKIVYGFWQQSGDSYVVKTAAVHDMNGYSGFSDCKVFESRNSIKLLNESDFVYRSSDSNILYSNKKLSEAVGSKDININEGLFKLMYKKLQEFAVNCKNQI